MAKARTDFNSSSIAIRRSLLEGREGMLSSLSLTVDSFFFALSLASEGSVFLDGRPLTFYRVHPGQHDVAFGDPTAFARAQERAAKVHLRDYEVMFALVKGTPYESYFKHLMEDSRLIAGLYGDEVLPAGFFRDLPFLFYVPPKGSFCSGFTRR